jgi:hypothetical protein
MEYLYNQAGIPVPKGARVYDEKTKEAIRRRDAEERERKKRQAKEQE